MKSVDDYASFTLDYITHVCDTYGERSPTSEAERKAANDLKEKLDEFSDETIKDEFTAIPGLYPQGLTRIAGFFVLIGLPFFFFSEPFNILAFILPFFGLFAFFVSLFLMKEWFGFLFKKGTSQNVLGKILPRNEKNEPVKNKRKIIISGHLDSAIQMKIQKLGDIMTKITGLSIIYVVIGMFLSIIKLILLYTVPDPITVSTTGVFTITYIDIIFLILSIGGVPLFCFVLYGYTGKTVVLGANDNLSGVGIAYAIGHYFTRDENRLKNIELWVGGFGSEECGERGAHAFVKKYGAMGELDNSLTLVPESCGAGTQLAIVSEEKMHFAVHDCETCEKVDDAYKVYKAEYEKFNNEKPIVPCKIEVLPLAASDGGRFSHAGYKATTLLGYDGKILKPANWHAVTDDPAHLDVDFLRASFEIIKQFVLLEEQTLTEKN
jgi:Peptidase family M28